MENVFNLKHAIQPGTPQWGDYLASCARTNSQSFTASWFFMP
jgi:hypothetical protein